MKAHVLGWKVLVFYRLKILIPVDYGFYENTKTRANGCITGLPTPCGHHCYMEENPKINKAHGQNAETGHSLGLPLPRRYLDLYRICCKI